MHISAVKSLLSALRQLSNQHVPGSLSGLGQTSSLQIGSITFSVERMITILVNNLNSMWLFFIMHTAILKHGCYLELAICFFRCTMFGAILRYALIFDLSCLGKVGSAHC